MDSKELTPDLVRFEVPIGDDVAVVFVPPDLSPRESQMLGLRIASVLQVMFDSEEDLIASQQ